MATAPRTAVAPCYVCVLAPSATCRESALDYRPFDTLSLKDIFIEATAQAHESAHVVGQLMFDRYDIAEPYFFGRVLTAEIVERLTHVSTVIIDCDIFLTDSAAIQDARRVLHIVARTPGTVIYCVQRTAGCCHSYVVEPALIIRSDLHLTNILEAHLWSREFTEAMAKHVNRT